MVKFIQSKIVNSDENKGFALTKVKILKPFVPIDDKTKFEKKKKTNHPFNTTDPKSTKLFGFWLFSKNLDDGLREKFIR